MRISPSPKTTEFFTLFGRAGENALEVARLVERPLPGASELGGHPGAGEKEETEGDTLARDLVTLLNTQYVTPFDRRTSTSPPETDDVVDYLEEASDLLGLYGIEMPHATRGRAVRRDRAGLRAAGDRLPQPQGHARRRRGARRAQAARGRGDRILRDALGSLFRDERIDPLNVIRWKDVYEALEQRSTPATPPRT